MQNVLSIFYGQKRGQKTSFFEILSGVLIRVGSSWAHYKAFARPQKVLPLFCPKSVAFEKKLEILSKINLESLFSNISAEVILAMLDLRQAAGSELQTLLLARVQHNLAMPQIGRGDLFWLVQSICSK